MWKYKNGNYTVKILDDGTKMRLSENPIPIYPESIDVKITNKCNGGCKFCHEMSTPEGKSFDVDLALKLFTELPSGVELAIGGGNPLECAQDMKWLCRKLKYDQIINVTINAMHCKDFGNGFGCNAVGISYRPELHSEIVEFKKEYNPHIVIHLIAGVHTIEDLKRCLQDFDKILILGYKKVGRGKEFYSEAVEKNLKDWKKNIWSYTYEDHKIISFDNLAIIQLDVKRFFNDNSWNRIYMGDDGEFSMYLDLVEEKYAVSSASKERFDINNQSIQEMFAHVRKLI